jgi:hypothetical protein
MGRRKSVSVTGPVIARLDAREVSVMFNEILITDTGAVERMEEDMREAGLSSGERQSNISVAREAVYATDLSPPSLLWKYISLPFLFITTISTFVLLIASFSQLAQPPVGRQASDLLRKLGTYATEPEYRGVDIFVVFVGGKDEEALLGAFPDVNNYLRVIASVITGSVLFTAFYWALRSRRVGLFVASLAMWACAVLSLAPLVLDMITATRSNLKPCYDCRKGVLVAHGVLICTCHRTRFFFIVVLDFLGLIFLLFNGYCVWRYGERLGMSQHAETGVGPNLAEVYYFFVNLLCPALNPACPFCLHRVPREALRWHKYYCESNLVPCLYCSKRVNMCRIDYHEATCADRDTKCPECGGMVAPQELDAHLALRCPRTEVRCIHCGKAMRREDLPTHTRNCESRPTCDFCGNRFMSEAERDQHGHEECLHRPIRCRRCKEMVPAHSIAEHEDRCGTALQPSKQMLQKPPSLRRSQHHHHHDEDDELRITEI